MSTSLNNFHSLKNDAEGGQRHRRPDNPVPRTQIDPIAVQQITTSQTFFDAPSTLPPTQLVHPKLPPMPTNTKDVFSGFGEALRGRKRIWEPIQNANRTLDERQGLNAAPQMTPSKRQQDDIAVSGKIPRTTQNVVSGNYDSRQEQMESIGASLCTCYHFRDCKNCYPWAISHP